MPILEDREIALKLISLLEAHNLKQDEKDKKKATRKKKATKTVESDTIEDPIKNDINKMLEKPKKRRKPKEEDDEYGEIDYKLENNTHNPEPQPQPQQPQQQTFLEQEPQPIKQTITEKPVKERPTPAKLFKDDLLMKIDPNERVKAIESAKNTILSQTAQPIKEEQAKTNINNFLTRYSKNKKY
jgi:hypothetical protein